MDKRGKVLESFGWWQGMSEQATGRALKILSIATRVVEIMGLIELLTHIIS